MRAFIRLESGKKVIVGNASRYDGVARSVPNTIIRRVTK